ncbi:MAG: HAD family hydrolase, partial [Candidatus Aenigmarchaeota archaeon]|nr:HAD family hydrolase [Candidatus Aenigmarchaeota archaeon]
RLCVLTNSYYERALYHLNTAGLLGYLDFVVTSDLVGSTKADKRMYRTAMELTKSKPGESLFVSSFGEDLTGASSAGMKTVLISSRIAKDRSDFQVRNISEIPRLQLLR